MSFALCSKVEVVQGPQYFKSSGTQATCDVCFVHQSTCSLISINGLQHVQSTCSVISINGLQHVQSTCLVISTNGHQYAQDT